MATENTTKQSNYDSTGRNISEEVFDPSAGPAAGLYTSKYTLGSNYGLVYPKNLGSSKRGHAVFFDIYEINPVTLEELNKKVTGLFTSDAAPDEKSKQPVENQTNKKTEPSGLTPLIQATNQISVNTRTKNNISSTIALYMPEAINFNYNAQYGNLNLASAAAAVPLVGGAAGAITSTLGGNEAVRLGLSAAGYVFNPQQQVLFEGIDFRSFQLSFTFTPTSEDETRNVNAIIKAFRYHAAPQIGGVGGFFFIPPSVFQISFRYDGKVNPNINLIKRSVLTDVDVNYAPNGWSAFDGNGAPTQTTMTLTFKEIILVDKTEIKKGY